jgi:hypothetical protein
MNTKFIAMLSESDAPHVIIRGEGRGIEVYDGKAFIKAWPKGRNMMIYGNSVTAKSAMKELNDKGAKVVPASYFSHEG